MNKRSTILSILVLSVFMIFAMASSSTDSSPSIINNGDSDSNSESSSNETTEVELVTPCEFTYNDIQVAIQTEYLGRIPNDNLGLYTLPSGQRYLLVGVGFYNGTNSDIFVSTSDFQVYADNILCDEVYVMHCEVDTSATISSGRTAYIMGFYPVPTDAETTEIEYEQSWLTDKLVITVGEFTSIYRWGLS